MSHRTDRYPCALNSSKSARFRALGLLSIIAASGVATADPVAPPPTCAYIDQLFCIRCTYIEDVTASYPGESDVYRFMLEFVNWTGIDAAKISMSINTGAADPDIKVVGAQIDSNGTPFGPVSNPPAGNMTPVVNNFFVQSRTDTSVTWSAFFPSDYIPHVQCAGTVQGNPVTFRGLLDTQYDAATPQECRDGLLCMIPGSTLCNPVDPCYPPSLPGDQPLISVADLETIDDGFNVLDGFVIDIANFDDGSVLSFNWFLLDEMNNPIGYITGGASSIQGDPYGFGIVNLANIGHPPPPPPSAGPAPAPGGILVAPNSPFPAVNSGFDPMDTSDPNIDNGRFWAEDEIPDGMGGVIDTKPINPIPAGRPGAGQWFGIEFGATVTAPFANTNDNVWNVGTNIGGTTGGGCHQLGDVNASGWVDLYDLYIIRNNFGLDVRQVPSPLPGNEQVIYNPRADIDGDGFVTILDATTTIGNIGVRCPRPVEPGPIGTFNEEPIGVGQHN